MKKTCTLPFAALSLSFSFLSVPVGAEPDEDWDGGFQIQAEARSGFVIGVEYGLGLGQISGYPMEAVKVDDPRYEANTGFGLGHTGRVWAGGAITDFYSFGLGVELLQLRGDGQRVRGGGFVMRNELFPLLSLGGRARDFGLSLEYGIGGMLVRREGRVTADGGSLGMIGVGAFFELVRGAGFSLGPAVHYTEYFSDTMSGHLAMLGLRGAFTAGP